MDLLVAGIGLVMVLVFGGATVLRRTPTRKRGRPPAKFGRRAQFGLRSLFLLTTLCAVLCLCLPAGDVIRDAVALTLCWTLCGLIGAWEGASWRGVGAWRGRAFGGAIGGATGSAIFAVAILLLGRPSFALAGDAQHALTHVTCLLVWGLCLGTLLGGLVSAQRFLNRRAFETTRDGDAAAVATWCRVGDPPRRRWFDPKTWLVAALASLLLHYAALYSPPFPLPGALSQGERMVDSVVQLEAVKEHAPRPRPTPVFVEREQTERSAGSNTQSRPAEPEAGQRATSEHLLRVASQRLGTDAPLCLDGYCPVALTERQAWVKGDPNLSAVYQGRSYQFNSEAARQDFLQRPETYAVVVSGYDPVLLLDEQRLEVGKREHGIFYGGGGKLRVFLFTSETTLTEFSTSVDHYMAVSSELQAAVAVDSMPANPTADSELNSLAEEKDQSVREVQVDLIELSHFWDEQGRLVFSQLILWSLYPDGKYHVRDWRMVKGKFVPQKRGDLWTCRWNLTKDIPLAQGKWTVVAPLFRETTTTVDPEVVDRKELPQEKRIPVVSEPPQSDFNASPSLAGSSRR